MRAQIRLLHTAPTLQVAWVGTGGLQFFSPTSNHNPAGNPPILL